MQVRKVAAFIPISQELLEQATEDAQALQRWMNATPEERAQWAREAETDRARERAAVPVVPLTLDGLLDKLGFSREYAEHLMQPYCYCSDGMDGWDRCIHADDLGLR